MRVDRVEALVIGGGVTGTGIARDLAMRGFDTMLVEAGDFSAGATGANHGMLHSGARYAVNDPISARECAGESAVLRRIARYCIEDTGGLFIATRQDDPTYLDRFLPACASAGVTAREIGVKEARELEPNLAQDIQAAVEVPDASIDPFFLTLGNVSSARRHGAVVFNHCPLQTLRRKNGAFEAIVGLGEERRTIRSEIIINAGGAWADQITSMVGAHIPLCVDKGSMVVLNGRLVNRLVNRLRPPSDGDILVPHRTGTILGTTSSPGVLKDIRATANEVRYLLNEAMAVVPTIGESRAVRAYAGVRPLLGTGSSGREASRAFQVIDHAADDIDGMISVVGGKLTTFRLMAEKAADLASIKLGRKGSCRTAVEEIVPYDSEASSDLTEEAARLRHGGAWKDVLSERSEPAWAGQGCGCEAVSRTEMAYFAASPDVRDIGDLMRRTRAGMGYCQASLCAVAMISALGQGVEELQAYYGERWKGTEPVLFGEQLRQEAFKAHLLKVYGIDPSREAGQ